MGVGIETTLGGLLDRVASERPDKEALIDLGRDRRLTWAEFAAETDALAKGFMALGLEPGAHLALWGGSSIVWILLQYAAAKVGLVVVSADPDASADGMAYLLEQSDAEALAAVAGYKDRDLPAIIRELCPESGRAGGPVLHSARLPRLRRLILAEGADCPGFLSLEHLIEIGQAVPDKDLRRRKDEVRPEDVTLLSYTSGTTGAPKGVMCTHHGLINKSRLSARLQNLGPEDKTGLLVPLYHMFGNTCALLTGMTAGAPLVIFGQFFDVERALEGLSRSKCTVIYGAPSQFIAMMEHPSYKKVDLSALRTGIMGGAPCPMEVMKKVVEDMGVSGILVGYGQTEASSWVTLTRPDDPLEIRVSTIGRALPEAEVKVIDPITGEAMPAGRPGELCTRGYLMAGYYKMPAATAKAVDQDGWLHTGDQVVMDGEGNCRVLGRLKELISKPEGEVSPVEIEEALFAHPDVVEAAVFGMPGADGREGVAAWLKLRPGAVCTADEVRAWCQGKLPPESMPELIHFTDSFPMTATGKIQKFKMVEITREIMGKKE